MSLEQARHTLQQVFGYEDFRLQQSQAIEAVLTDRDCLVLMPTGGGKSLCYQIPMLVKPGLGIVVSPLIALMHDQVMALRQLGIRAAFLNSSLDNDIRQQLWRDLAAEQIDILYVAPETLLQPRTLDTLSQLQVSLIGIDEAHCVAQWGHDFRRDYLDLYRLAEIFPGVPRIALTATADPATREEIVTRLQLNAPLLLVDSFDRPNISYSVAAKGDPTRQLLNFLDSRRGQAGIVYCLSRKKVESTAEKLVAKGFDALPYHAGLSTQLRETHQQRFLNDDGVIIVATIAFGMGIDKPDVRFVAHLDLPKSVEAYYQETGRAGRDGSPADAWMVYGLQDVVRLSQMVEQSGLSETMKRVEQQKLNALLGWCEITRCRRQALLAYFGETLADACGNCDICQVPPVTRDSTENARKLLSAVYRSGQRFGTAYVIDILMGKATDKIVQNHHEALSTFGIGKELDKNSWQSLTRQLLVQGYLFSDAERFGALRLTEKSGELLRGETGFTTRQDSADTTVKRRQRAEPMRIDPDDKPLWDALRETRKALAEANNVPPYVICSNDTLQEMTRLRPRDERELLMINGIGEARLERYGRDFLQVIAEF